MLNKLKNIFRPIQNHPHDSHTAISYRPDIDGLRALAVLLVIIYHAFPTILNAGFIGVDIFFVISGYLISSIIVNDLENGKFSILNFYNRRIRRIFPALILVLLFVSIFGWIALFPNEYTELGKHLFGGTTFISNFVLWSEAGYFATASQLKPLLHLWSLGIEEQFYIFFPLILFLCYKYRFCIPKIVAFLCILSFIYNIYIANKSAATVDFYSPLSRVWELMLGAVLSTASRKKTFQNLYTKLDATCAHWLRREGDIPNDGRSFSLILASLAMIFLIISLLIIHEGAIYPSWKAFLPVLTALCFIAAGQANIINKYFLSNRFIVFIGLLSYSLYLWHWPILSFARILNGELTGEFEWILIRLSCIALSFFLAFISYQYIEKPFRFSKRNRSIKIILLCSLMTCICIFGVFLYKNEGVKSRYEVSQTDFSYIDKKLDNFRNYGIEDFPEINKLASPFVCRISKRKGNNQIALIGDSYSAHLYAGLIDKLPEEIGIENFNASCAAPYIDIACAWTKKHDFRKNAYKVINKGYESILSDDNIKTVILSHNAECSYEMIKDLQDESITDRDVILERGMRRTFDKLTEMKKNIICVLQHPSLPWWPLPIRNGELPRKLNFINYEKFLRFDRKNFDNEAAPNWYKRILNKVIVDYPNVKVVALSDLFCDDKLCYVSKNNSVLYLDRGHLNYIGSIYVADKIIDALPK